MRNLPGDNGVLGTQALVDADRDGHTLMISSVSPAVVTPLLLPERTYRVEDFAFLGVVRSAPVVLFTAADSPVDSAESLPGGNPSRCLSTDNVQRDIGAEFVPADQIGAGEQRARYWELQRSVRPGLNLAEIEGR